MAEELPVTEVGSSCGCGCHPAAPPELDARQIPKQIRHGAILGALSSVQVGAAMVLVAPHDPLPLLDQVNELFGDAIEVSYVDRAEGAVKVKFTKLRAV